MSAILFPVAVFVGGVAALLLIVADSAGGRLMGLAFVALCVGVELLPFALFPGGDPGYSEEEVVAFARWRAQARRRRIGPVLGVITMGFLALTAAAMVSPPAEVSDLRPRPGLQTVWLGPARPSRVELARLTPERDQMALASWLMPFADPLFDLDQASRLRPAMRSIYAEMANDPSYGRAASVLGLAYGELFGADGVTGQVFVDLPPGDGPFPALVFIHGFGGNALSYPWVLRRVAHAHGYAIVAPGYGAGLWYQDEGPAVVERALRWMAESGRFDMDRVALAGLSNGGFGVAAVLESRPWRGVAWLSAVLGPEDVEGITLGGPALILHGGADDRIPVRFPSGAAERLRAQGARVDLDVVPDADHFLLFTHRARVDAALERWFGAMESP